jgi:hypothetical protein
MARMKSMGGMGSPLAVGLSLVFQELSQDPIKKNS